MSSPVRAKLKDGGGETIVQYSKQDRSWTFIDANKATQKIKNITGTRNKTGMSNFFDNTDAFGAQKDAEKPSTAEKKRQKTARERQNLGASPASSATPGSELVPSKQMTRQQEKPQNREQEKLWPKRCSEKMVNKNKKMLVEHCRRQQRAVVGQQRTHGS